MACSCAQFQLERYEAALENFNLAIDEYNLDAQYFYWRGLAEFYLGKYKEALGDFTQAVSFDLNNDEYVYWCGQARFRLDEFSEAIEDFTRAIKNNSENDDYFFSRGIVYYKAGNYQRALNDFSQAIKFDSKNGQYFYWHAMANRKLEKYQDALKFFNKAEELRYISWGELFYERGLVYKQLGQFIEALEDYKKAQELGIRSYELFNQATLLCYSQKDYLGAIEYWHKARQLVPLYDSEFKYLLKILHIISDSDLLNTVHKFPQYRNAILNAIIEDSLILMKIIEYACLPDTIVNKPENVQIVREIIEQAGYITLQKIFALSGCTEIILRAVPAILLILLQDESEEGEEWHNTLTNTPILLNKLLAAIGQEHIAEAFQLACKKDNFSWGLKLLHSQNLPSIDGPEFKPVILAMLQDKQFYSVTLTQSEHQSAVIRIFHSTDPEISQAFWQACTNSVSLLLNVISDEQCTEKLIQEHASLFTRMFNENYDDYRVLELTENRLREFIKPEDVELCLAVFGNKKLRNILENTNSNSVFTVFHQDIIDDIDGKKIKYIEDILLVVFKYTMEVKHNLMIKDYW